MRLIFASEQEKAQSRNRTGDKGTKSRRNREGENLGKTKPNTEKTYYHVIKGQKAGFIGKILVFRDTAFRVQFAAIYPLCT